MSVGEAPVDVHTLFHHDGEGLDELVHRAVGEALRRHAGAGHPVAEWSDAGAAWLPADAVTRRLDAFRWC